MTAVQPAPGDRESNSSSDETKRSPSSKPNASSEAPDASSDLRGRSSDFRHASSDARLAARQKSLEQFRGSHGKRLEIHPREKLLVWLLGIHVSVLPWVIGDMRLWSQIPSLVVGVIGLGLALLPRNYSEEHTASGSFRLIMWPKLFRFPVFWIGALLLGYVAVQALNPAWEYRSDGKVWWMRRIDYVSWLPAGVEAPFERWGPWRILMIYTTVWLTVCTLWVGITRRRVLQTLLVMLAVNGLVLALFGLSQQLLGNGRMYWFWRSPNPSFFASFVYKNHAAAYLNLALAITCGLAGWYYLRGIRRLQKSNPSGVFVFFATCIAVAVFVSFARGATIFMLLFLLLASAGFVIHQLRAGSERRKPAVLIGLVIAMAAFVYTGARALDTDKAWIRLKRGVLQEDLSLQARQTATRASIDMLKAYWPAGAGAGSFRFLFTPYQHKYPEIFARGTRRMWWEHAHNDVVQFPIELGLGGMVLLLAGIGYFVFQLLKAHFWRKPLCSLVVAGLVLMLVYSWWDFPFQNPAILMLAATLLVAATMWARFEESSSRS